VFPVQVIQVLIHHIFALFRGFEEVRHPRSVDVDVMKTAEADKVTGVVAAALTARDGVVDVTGSVCAEDARIGIPLED